MLVIILLPYKGELPAMPTLKEQLRRLRAQDINGGETQQFGMSVTGSYRNDTMRRQISRYQKRYRVIQNLRPPRWPRQKMFHEN